MKVASRHVASFQLHFLVHMFDHVCTRDYFLTASVLARFYFTIMPDGLHAIQTVRTVLKQELKTMRFLMQWFIYSAAIMENFYWKWGVCGTCIFRQTAGKSSCSVIQLTPGWISLMSKIRLFAAHTPLYSESGHKVAIGAPTTNCHRDYCVTILMCQNLSTVM